MHPILFRIPLGGYEIPVPGYGFMLALGFSVALFLVVRRARVEDLDPEAILNSATYVILAALIGSRFFHVLIEKPSYYLEHPLDAFKIWQGGYTFYGGMIPAALVLWWYLKKHKIPLLKTLDIFATYLALGQTFGRIGCFLAGCCHGKVCDYVLFPVSYVASDPFSFSRPLGIPLYATQVWQAAANFTVFLFLLWLRRKKQFHGQLLAGYLILYAIFRIIIEIFRGDDIRGFLIPGLFSTSQFIGILMIIMGIFVIVKAPKTS